MKRSGFGPRKTRLRSLSEKKAHKPTRGAWINRTTKQRKGRKSSETARIYGPPARRAWMKAQACAWCVRIMMDSDAVRRGGCHNAHTVTGGIVFIETWGSRELREIIDADRAARTTTPDGAGNGE